MTMKRHTVASELDDLTEIKGNILDAKRELRQTIALLSKRMGDYNAEGFIKAEAAAMKMRGACHAAMAELDKAHSETMLALCDCFEDGPDIIRPLGGGRPR